MARLKTLKPLLPQLGQQAKPRGWADTRATSSSSRGYGWAWQQARQRVLERDCGLCQVCKAAGRLTPAAAVDHVTCKADWARDRGSLAGVDDDANLQSICDDCHKLKTAAESARARAQGSAILGPVRRPDR